MRTPCSVPDCERPNTARSLCTVHYQRWRRTGSLVTTKQRAKGLTCTAEGCNDDARAAGLCENCYKRHRRNGTTDYTVKVQYDRRGDKNPKWRGADAGYSAAHRRVAAAKGSAAGLVCACGAPTTDWAYDNLDPDERWGQNGPCVCAYSLDIEHYVPMCRRCHKRMDVARRQAAA